MRSLSVWAFVLVGSLALLAFGNRLPELAGATAGWCLQSPRTPNFDNRKPSELLAPDAMETSPGLVQLARTAR